MSNIIEGFGELVRDYIFLHGKTMSFGAVVLRSLPLMGSVLIFVTGVDPQLLNENVKTVRDPGLCLVVQLLFGIAVILFWITPPVYPHVSGKFSVRQLLHVLLLLTLPFFGVIYLVRACEPFVGMGAYGIGFFTFLLICLVVTTVLLWAAQPEKWPPK